MPRCVALAAPLTFQEKPVLTFLSSFRTCRAGAALSVATLVVLTGCASQTGAADDGGSGTSALRPVTVVLDWTPNTNHLGLYLAQERGWFREAGLDLKIIEPGETSGLGLVGAGKADLAFSVAESLVPTRERGADVVSVATIIQENTSSLISLTDDGISRPRDLVGKNYGSYGGALEEALIGRLVECDGGDPSKVNFVPRVSDDMRIGLTQDQFDTTWVFDAWDTVRLREVDKMKVSTIPFAEHTECIPNWYTPLLAASGEAVRSGDPLISDAVAVIERGYRAAIDDPQAGAEALLKAVPELDRRLVEPSARYLGEHFAPSAEEWGGQDPAVWQGFVDFLVEHELAGADFDVAGAWTNDLLS